MKKRILLLLSIAFLLISVMPILVFADSQSTTVKYSVKATVIYVEYDGVQTVQKVTVGSTLKEPTHKEKVGSRFLGWQNKDTGLFWNFQDPVTDHLTLIASYETINNSGHGSSSGGGGGSHSSASSSGAVTSGAALPSSGEMVPSDETNPSIETVSSDETIPSGETASRAESEQSASQEQSRAQASGSATQNHGSGTFFVEVRAENGIADSSINIDQEQWLDHLMESGAITSEDLSQVNAGTSMKISLIVESIGSTISCQESIEQMKTAAEGYTIGQYMDISVYKTMIVNGVETGREKIYTTGELLTISVRVPDEMINTDETIIRQYFVIRNHNGVVDILDAQFDAETHMLTFETNQFSDYAIAYKDSSKEQMQDIVSATKNSDSKAEENGNPDLPSEQQEKQAGNYSFILIIALVLIIFLLVLKRRKKDQENK